MKLQYHVSIWGEHYLIGKGLDGYALLRKIAILNPRKWGEYIDESFFRGKFGHNSVIIGTSDSKFFFKELRKIPNIIIISNAQ